MFRTFDDALRHLARFTDYERMAVRAPRGGWDLDRMRRLTEALGHPERAFRSLHVAGTTGKGSTAHLAEALLRASGRRTGLYTSPHLLDLRERIRLDGVPVTPRAFTWAMNRMERALRRLKPTFFETMTAAAFLLFARRRVDAAVVEVGLGGRLDATNVLEPAACAITPVGPDHAELLGRTIASIAREKAAIVKPGTPVVTGPQPPAAMREIRKRGVPLRPGIHGLRRRGFVVRFRVRTPAGRVHRCALRVLGDHQAANAAVALALVEAGGFDTSGAAVRRAFRDVRLPARAEIVGRRPWTVVDAAHNVPSARALARALTPLRRRRTVLVFGAHRDKDARGMLAALRADLAILTRARNPRAADPAELAGAVRGPAVRTRDVAEAVALARRLAGPEDAVVVTGSFTVAGEALEALDAGVGSAP